MERHEHGHSLSRIRDSHRISWATTERWVHQRYSLRVAQQAQRVAPKVLGIDEHFFTRKAGFATTFANLETHRVFDVQLGRSELALQRYLGSFTERGLPPHFEKNRRTKGSYRCLLGGGDKGGSNP